MLQIKIFSSDELGYEGEVLTGTVQRLQREINEWLKQSVGKIEVSQVAMTNNSDRVLISVFYKSM